MNWNTDSFCGKYHVWNIRSKFAIPGTAVMRDLRAEQEFSQRLPAMDQRLQSKKSEADVGLKQLQEAIKVRENLQYSDRIDNLISKVSNVLDDEELLLEKVTALPKRLARQSAARFLSDIEGDKVAHVQRSIEIKDMHVDQLFRGETALHIACRLGRPQMLSMLLKQGANQEAIDSRGNRAIHNCWVCKTDAVSTQEANGVVCELLTLLLQFGANPDSVTFDNNSPLHLASSHGPSQSVWLLLLKGRASCHLINKDGLTAMEIAHRHGQEEICRMIGSWPRIEREMRLQDLLNGLKSVKETRKTRRL